MDARQEPIESQNRNDGHLLSMMIYKPSLRMHLNKFRVERFPSLELGLYLLEEKVYQISNKFSRINGLLGCAICGQKTVCVIYIGRSFACERILDQNANCILQEIRQLEEYVQSV